MAYLTPQQIFQQLLIEREQAVRREFAVYRGEEVEDTFDEATMPDEAILVHQGKAVGHKVYD